MYPAGALLIVGLGIIIWLGILSYLFWKEKKFLNKLFPKSQSREDAKQASLLIKEQFDNLLEEVEEVKRKNQVIVKQFRELAKEGLGYIQKIAVFRYNPYGDTGGDQSFSIALLDGKDNGFVLTSLHSRSATRVYIKEIKDSKASLELSKEEKQVLQKVLNKEI